MSSNSPTEGGTVDHTILWSAPPLDWTLAEDEIHIWCATLEGSPADLQRFLQILSEDELKRAARFCFERDRNRFIIGRGLLRSVLGRYLRMEPGELVFGYSARGKPSLALVSTRVRFNLAHSEDLVLYAVTQDREIGVDLEVIRPIADLQGIARRFFCEAETARLLALPLALQAEGFLNCWTRKEAYLKATGEGITVALDQFEVSLAPGEPAVLLRDKLNPKEASYWSLSDLRPASGSVAALAVKQRGLRVYCWRWAPV